MSCDKAPGGLLKRVVLAALVVLSGVNVSSCTSYALIGEGSDLTSDSLAKGTHLRIHLGDGSVARGTVVRVSDKELVCKTETYPLDSIEYVEREGGTVWGYVLFFLGLPAMGALMVLLSGGDFGFR